MEVVSSGGLFIRVVSHHRGGLPVQMVSHQDGLSSGRSLHQAELVVRVISPSG